MKSKVVSIFIVLALLLSSFGVSFATTNNSQKDIKIILDGQTLELGATPIIVNGSTLVPMRGIFEAMGATVNWDGESQIAYATKGLKIIQMHLDWNCLYINNVYSKTDSAPTLINNVTYVPVRAIAEGLNATVEWIDGNVVITSNTTGYAEYPLVPDYGKMFNCQETKSQIVESGEGAKSWSNYYHYYSNASSSVASLTAYTDKLVELGYVQSDTQVKNGIAVMVYTNASDNSAVTMAKAVNSVFIVSVSVPVSLDDLNLKATN
jgi:hypothetical protein